MPFSGLLAKKTSLLVLSLHDLYIPFPAQPLTPISPYYVLTMLAANRAVGYRAPKANAALHWRETPRNWKWWGGDWRPVGQGGHTTDYPMHGMRSVWGRCPKETGFYPRFSSISSPSASIDFAFPGESRGRGARRYTASAGGYIQSWGQHLTDKWHLIKPCFFRRGMQLSFPCEAHS